MKKLLVTGASGFLGGRVVEYYRGRYEVCAPTHGEIDIVDREQVMKKLKEWRPDVIVHCAAISDIRQCEKEPERSWDINVEGSVNMARAAGLVGARCLLCSSDQVYFGSREKGPHREEEVLAPGNLYAREKLHGEEKCLEVNPDCVHLRLSWMYDARTLHPGEHSDFVRTLLAKTGTEEKFSYPVRDRRGITDVNEVVRNLEAAFSLEGGVYNFGAPGDKNMYEIAYGLFSRLGWDTGRLVKNEEAYASAPRDLTMSQEKLNGCGIYFTETEDALVRCIQAAVRNLT